MALSTWVDDRTATVERCAFVPTDDGSVLVISYEPSVPADRVFVLCGSLFDEIAVNTRREVFLARRLAAAGHACVRFHYRGTGNSDDPVDGPFTLATMIGDARAALDTVRRNDRDLPVVFVGIRIGALVAGRLAENTPGAGLALWEPALNGAAFFREMIRSDRIAGLRATSSAAQESTFHDGLLGQSQCAELLGHLIHRATYDSLENVSLPAHLGASPRPIFLVQQSRGAELRRPYRDLVDRWATDGHHVRSKLVQQARAWWFLADEWVSQDLDAATDEVAIAFASWVASLGVAS